jgi:hypothetical protein
MSESFTITQQPAPASASATRRKTAISAIVIQLSTVAATKALASYTAKGSKSAPHYHVAADGTITQLVAEERAALHSGMAKLGRRRNINLLSIGIVAEQTKEGRVAAASLRWLVTTIQTRHGLLAENALLRWFAPEGGATDGRVEQYALPEVVQRRAVLSAETTRGPALLGVPTDPATSQRLWAFLQNEASKVRGGSFNSGSAFHLHAAKMGMGAPLGASSPRAAWVTVAGRSFNYQHFARDTAFNEGENWTSVQNLSERLQGSFPAPNSVEYLLLQSAYAAGLASSKPTSGNTKFNPGWASTQTATQQRLGPTLSGAYRITVDGNAYTVQVFGTDTLYTPIANPESGTNWADIRKLSETPAGNLRNALWAETYKPCGAAYTASSPLQQAAEAAKIGAPLTGVYQAAFEGANLTIQVFALDTLYQEGTGPVNQQSKLTQPTQVANWAPKASNPLPTPPPTAAPISVPAANIVVPAGDKGSASWPPPPTSLKPMPSTTARQAAFGKYEYVADPVAGNAERIKILGTWKEENIVPVAVPQLAALAARGIRGAPKSGTMFFNKRAVKQLLGLWKAWEDAGLLDRVIGYFGDFNARFIRGSKTELSQHAFGTAFDINVEQNGLGVQPALVGQRGSVRELVPIANAFGFYWGGHFSRLDGMHFEVAQVMG